MELERPQGHSVRAGTPEDKTPKAYRSRSAPVRRERPKPSSFSPISAMAAAARRRVVASARSTSALATTAENAQARQGHGRLEEIEDAHREDRDGQELDAD